MDITCARLFTLSIIVLNSVYYNKKGACFKLNNFSKILGAKLLKIEDVNKATGISRTTLTNLYYRRQNNVELNTLKKICDYLQISLSDLIEYIPESIAK